MCRMDLFPQRQLLTPNELLAPPPQVSLEPPYRKLPAPLFASLGLALHEGLWTAPDQDGALKLENCCAAPSPRTVSSGTISVGIKFQNGLDCVLFAS